MNAADRELLEFAAKAVGIDLHWNDREESGYYENYRGLPQWVEWNAAHDDGDALRLACRLGFKVDANFKSGADQVPGVGVWTAGDTGPYPPFWTANAKDICKDTRHTIVRAAAEIGKAMP